MENEARKEKKRFGAIFNTLRFQILAIMLLCYLIPALLLGLFTQQILLKSVRDKTESALTASVEHAWTLTDEQVQHAVALARDAVYDGELADA